MKAFVENAIAFLVMGGLGAVFWYALLVPEPGSEALLLGQELSRQVEYEDFIQCLSSELSRYPNDPTDEQYKLAEEWCTP